MVEEYRASLHFHKFLENFARSSAAENGESREETVSFRRRPRKKYKTRKQGRWGKPGEAVGENFKREVSKHRNFPAESVASLGRRITGRKTDK